MNAETQAALKAAHVQLAERITAEAGARIIAAADAALWDVSEAGVRDVKQRRSGAVAANRPTDVRRINDELGDAEAERECAAARAAASAKVHAEAVKAVRDAEGAVTEAARAQLESELLDLADRFTVALDGALAIGEQLKALALRDRLNMPISDLARATADLPAEVKVALARLPSRNWRDIPMNELRERGHGDAYGTRLAQLTAGGAA